MNIHIKWENDKKGIVLPINPQEFEISDGMNNTSVYVHGLGEINLKGKRNLRTISISSFFPHEELSFAHDKFRHPYNYYVKKLKALFEKNKTVHLIITDTDISMYCTVENFTYGESDRSGDVSYTLDLKEYLEISRQKKKRARKDKKEGIHVWKKGDTWQKLTKTCLGSSEKWKSVRLRNKAVINKAKKKEPKKKEKEALIGYKVVVKE